jgi:hypothetical protein
VQIEENEVHFAVFQVLECRLAVAGFIDVVACAAEVMGERKSFNGGVVTEEKSRAKQVSRRNT